MRAKGSIWQPDEVQILRNHAQTHTALQVAKMLGRTEHSINQKASELKIRFVKRGEKAGYAKYSDELVEGILLRFFAGETAPKIGADLGIPPDTITNWTSGQQRPHLLAKVIGVR